VHNGCLRLSVIPKHVVSFFYFDSDGEDEYYLSYDSFNLECTQTHIANQLLYPDNESGHLIHI